MILKLARAQLILNHIHNLKILSRAAAAVSHANLTIDKGRAGAAASGNRYRVRGGGALT